MGTGRPVAAHVLVETVATADDSRIDDFSSPSDDDEEKEVEAGTNPQPLSDENKTKNADPHQFSQRDVVEEDKDDEFSSRDQKGKKVEGAPSTAYIHQAVLAGVVPPVLTQDDAGIDAYHRILVKDMLHMTGDFFNIFSQLLCM